MGPGNLHRESRAALNIDNRQVKADLRKFKNFIESQGTETGAWRGEVDDPGPTGQI